MPRWDLNTQCLLYYVHADSLIICSRRPSSHFTAMQPAAFICLTISHLLAGSTHSLTPSGTECTRADSRTVRGRFAGDVVRNILQLTTSCSYHGFYKSLVTFFKSNTCSVVKRHGGDLTGDLVVEGPSIHQQDTHISK